MTQRSLKYIVPLILLLSVVLSLVLLNDGAKDTPITAEVIKVTDIREGYEVKETYTESVNGIIAMTLNLTEDTVVLPYQNGIVYPDFLPQDRMIVSLNGQWKKQRFDSDYHFSLEPRTEDWIAKAEAEAGNAHLMDFDMSGWDDKLLPSPENTLKPVESTEGVEPYENGVYYRRTFELDNTLETDMVFLKSLGISYICDVWINGHYVGYHEGGFTPFAFDISPYLTYDQANVILIRVDNPPWGKRLDTIPANRGTDFFNYTGIIQDIYLEATNRIMIPRVDLKTESLDGTVKGNIVLSNHDSLVQTVSVRQEAYIADKDKYADTPELAALIGEGAPVATAEYGAIELSSQTDIAIDVELTIENPLIWDVAEPNLYIIKTIVEDLDGNILDVLHSQFGIRTIETEGTKLLLNDENYFAQGIARHEEWPGYGRTATWDRIVTDLNQMKEMSVTLIRTGHYPNHVYTYMYLDRIGIPSMSEIPLWQLSTTHFERLEEKGLALQMFREMVYSQYNSPSVIMWSTQNECVGTEARRAYNQKLVDDLHNNYDDGRLITQSAAADQGGPADASMEPLDVNGWTMYFGVFHGSTPYNGTRNFLEQASKQWDKPIINTEYGVWSGADDADAVKQAQFYKWTYDAMMEYATISPSGYMKEDGILAGIDYWIMYNWYVNHNEWIDTFGIYHMDREKMKSVGKAIVEDYSRQYLSKDLHNIVPETFSTSIVKEPLAYQGAAASIVLFDPMDFSKYPYLTIELTISEKSPIGHIILEDSDGKQWHHYTDAITADSQTKICVPLYRSDDIDMTSIKHIQISFSKEKAIVVHRMDIQH